ncbi:hypothetical protein Tco_0683465 [Tanacetum coccineum]|uniref:Uncharacterized protein n=1 Tax=Tanacetum coccineum TaxID=301880 RepID=A0ABQ4XV43_9ASTR
MTDFAPGRAVIDVAQHKHGKYLDKCATIGYDFLPFSFSSLGELQANAVTLLKRIQKFSMVQDIRARAAIHIFNRISFAIAKGIGGVCALSVAVVCALFHFLSIVAKALEQAVVLSPVWLGLLKYFHSCAWVRLGFCLGLSSLGSAKLWRVFCDFGFFLGFCDFGRGCPSDLVVDSVDRSFLSYLQKTLWAVVLGSV